MFKGSECEVNSLASPYSEGRRPFTLAWCSSKNDCSWGQWSRKRLNSHAKNSSCAFTSTVIAETNTLIVRCCLTHPKSTSSSFKHVGRRQQWLMTHKMNSWDVILCFLGQFPHENSFLKALLMSKGIKTSYHIRVHCALSYQSLEHDLSFPWILFVHS